MIIHSLELENIRSYDHARVDFEEGITLLAGDIGAGKSTILLALEFALFGIRRGDIAGDGLLRHGTQEGSVTIGFTCGPRVLLCRTLKRSSQGVRQDGGWIEQDGKRESLTANELKARVIALLGYPDDLLTKSKGFVFRYTVYTPQEEMKQILFESDQQRLDTLRSVFGIDRYRSVLDNATMLGRSLRDRERYLAGQADDLDALRAEEKALRLRSESQGEECRELKAAEEASENALGEAKALGASLEDEYLRDQKRKQELSGQLARQHAVARSLAEVGAEMDRVNKRVSEEREPVADPTDTIERVRLMREEQLSRKSQAATRLSALAEKRQEIADEDIESLTTCPKCRQPVTDDHKEHVRSAAESRLKEIDSQEQRLKAIIDAVDTNLGKLDNKMSSLKEETARFQEYRRWSEQRAHSQDRLKELSEKRDSLSEEQRVLAGAVLALGKSSFDERSYLAHKQRLEHAERSFRESRVARMTAEARLQGLAEQLKSLIGRIDKKVAAQDALIRIRVQERWVSDAFGPVVSLIEKHVLASIQAEFSRRFTEWFDMLLQDEALFASLSPQFSPVLTQDGYDVDVAHLSGGEKTSVALAYRLALNSVINDIIATLKTTDLLILDEPTDGFSAEQLDRVRDVLLELSNKQVILVSHEQKMESFCDRVIRIVKHEGVSQVA